MIFVPLKWSTSSCYQSSESGRVIRQADPLPGPAPGFCLFNGSSSIEEVTGGGGPCRTALASPSQLEEQMENRGLQHKS